MKIYTKLALIIGFISSSAFSQLSITNGGINYTIDFDNTVSGVNEAQFAGTGFAPNPSSGQLDSDAWAVTGLSDGSLTFGGTVTTGDFARGSSTGGVTTGGIYAFEVASSNRAFGIQPGSGDWTAGDITLRLLNNSGGSITSMAIAYDIYVRNDQDRANSFNFSYSFNGNTFFPVTDLDYTSPDAPTGTNWIINARSTTLSQFNIANGSYFYLRWSGDDVSGINSRDEFALDNIALTATVTTNTIVYFSSTGLLANEYDGSVFLPVSIQNPSAIPTQVDVYLTDNNYSPDINGFISQTIVFPANSSDDQLITISVNNDLLLEGLESLQFTFQNVSGGSSAFTGYPNIFVLGIVDNELPNAWINELHYDNSSTDAGEFVEVVIQNQISYTLSDFVVTLYNGSNGLSYGTHDLSSFTIGAIDPNDNTFRYFSKAIAGIQNGAPDGLCLSYQGSVIQLLSYEGTFTATNGPANGLTSIDIGVSQNGSEPIGSSLGLTGSGTQYSDFIWTDFLDDTPGSPNGSQALPVELTSFSATTIGSTVKLNWKTETEINNYGFEIERYALSAERQAWEKIGFVNGNGNSNSPKSYSYEDKNVTAGKYSYRLKQIDNDGQFEYSKAIEVDLGAPKKFELSQNYPNPFNPTTTIKFNLPEAGNVKLTLFNILGQELRTLVNEFKESGVHTINFDASDLNSGMYIYKLEAGSFVQTRKMTLIK